MATTIIYHSGCVDGTSAAFLARKALLRSLETPETITTYGATHGNPVPAEIYTGQNVVMVDWCPQGEDFDRILSDSAHVIILDHHLTAMQQLAKRYDFDPEAMLAHDQVGSVEFLIDQNRSGCGITYDYFFGATEPRTANHAQGIRHHVNAIEDRDIWRKTYRGSAEFFAAVTSYPYTDIEEWNLLFDMPYGMLVDEGISIERYRETQIALIMRNARVETVCGVEMPVVNCPYSLGSEVAGRLAADHPAKVAAYYLDTATDRQWGLRSTQDGPDVAGLAAIHAGGGHRSASGFRTARP